MAYLSISAWGTSTSTSVSPSPFGVIPRMRPRLLFRSPMMSPAYMSGTVTSAFITGSSSTGLASRTPLEKA